MTGDAMTLREYFDNTDGMGVFSSADADGRVDAAVYSKPQVLDDGTLAFVMRDRLTHHNIQSNPCAAFLFREDAPGYKGVRIFLKKIREDSDPDLLDKMIRKRHASGRDKPKEPAYVVYFSVLKILPLIGAGEPGIEL